MNNASCLLKCGFIIFQHTQTKRQNTLAPTMRQSLKIVNYFENTNKRAKMALNSSPEFKGAIVKIVYVVEIELKESNFFVLFDLILYVQVNNFQSRRDGSPGVESVLSRG